MTPPAAARIRSRPELRLGFVPLLDAAPLIVAHELGYFADEGMTVSLERQIGWGNIRDKLVYGHLHASHALVGMPPASQLGHDRFAEPVVAVMGLGTGGNAITIGRWLFESGVRSAATLAEWIAGGRRLGGNRNEPPLFAHVFGCSMHHYLLREWLSTARIDPDRDVRLCVLPPPQMATQMSGGNLDGFCVGEPWNTAAEEVGVGRVLLPTTDIVPEHPEKVLAVNRRWLARHGEAATALVRALLKACAYCHEPANAGQVAEVLAKPAYLNVSKQLLLSSLKGESPSAGGAGGISPNCDPSATFPSATHAAWVLTQMVRWGHLPATTDVWETARRSVDTGVYRRAAEAAGVACPAGDFPPMRLRDGWFGPPADAAQPAANRGLLV